MRRSSVLLKWVITYMLIIMIPLGCFAYGIIHSTAVVREQVALSNRQTLSSLSERTDRLLSRMSSMLFYVASQTSLADFAQALTLEQAMHSGSDLQKAIRSWQQSVETDISVLLYHERYQYLLSPECGTALSVADLVMSGFEHFEAGPWNNEISRSYPLPEYMIRQGFRWNDYRKCFVYALSFRGHRSPVNIFISVPVDELDLMDIDQRILLILSGDGSIRYSTDEDVFPAGDIVEVKDGHVRRETEDYISEAMEINRSDLQLILLSDASQYWGPLRKMVRIIGALFVLSLILSVILTVAFVQHSYAPVRKLMALTDAGKTKQDEFVHIEKSIRLLKDNVSSMQSTLQVQSRQLRASYLLSVLKGKQTALSDHEFMTYFDLPESNVSWMMILLSVSELGVEEQFDDYLAENDTMFSLTMAVEKLLGGYRHDWIEDGRLAVCILQLEEGKEWDAERFAAQFRELTASMNVRAVLGRPVKAFRELSQEYFDATNAMIYLQTVSESGLMPLTEYRAMMSNPSVMKESRWQKLLEDIQSGDTERTADDVKEIFGGHRIRNARIPVLKMQLAGRLNEIMTLYCENNPAQDVAQTFFPGMEAFLRAQNLEEMQKSFQALSVMTARGIDRSDTMADQVCAYVQEHYADPDLNISYLAEVFHRNPQTLSRLFRAQKGQGLLDYISMVRVDRARELIRTGDASLEKIAGMVGFTNVRTFRRAFVKQYGMLPSEM